MTTAPPRWLTLDEAAAYLRLREDRFRRMVRAGKLPAPSRRLGPRRPPCDFPWSDAIQGGVGCQTWLGRFLPCARPQR